jgi:RimJ/RimL family protein N-acetyltransferase
VVVRLDSGVEVTVRPIRPDDKALLADGLARLSDGAAYQRFLAPKTRLTAEELRHLTEIDFRDHVALVAVRADAPGVLVGVARWIRSPADPEVAEIAYVVGDELRRQGVGTALAQALADSARERGVREFVATMLPDNRAAHRLFARVAARPRIVSDGGVDELRGELAA